MSASKRATLIGKLNSALKKHYNPLPAQPARPLLEHVLYASLLQDAAADLADEGMAKCEQEFYDWNEVRVTTVTELAQVLSRLPEPMTAARRMKSNLQAIFEEFYTFDLDHLKKENLGKAVNKFDKMPDMTPFVLSYTVQHGLGGHSIPVDFWAMVVMLSTQIASQPEAWAGKVPGLERAIPKSRGIEFSGLLHQAAIALSKNTKDKASRAFLDAVNKGSSQRLDEWLASKKAAKKRVVKRKVEERVAAKVAAEAEALAALEAARNPPKKKRAKESAKKETPVLKPATKEPAKPAAKKPAVVKPTKKTPPTAAGKKTATGKKDSLKKDTAKKDAAKKPVKKASTKSKPTKKAVSSKKKTPAKKPAKKAVSAKKKTPAKKAVSAKKKTPAKKAVTSKKKTPAKKPAKKAVSAKKTTPAKKVTKKVTKKATPAKKKTTSKKSPPKAKSAKKASAKKSTNRKLTKRKPR